MALRKYDAWWLSWVMTRADLPLGNGLEWGVPGIWPTTKNPRPLNPKLLNLKLYTASRLTDSFCTYLRSQ